jgi:hypothetical protein
MSTLWTNAIFLAATSAVDIDVEDEIRHFLDHDPRGVVGAELFAVSKLAAAADADLGTGADFRLSVGGNGEELIPAGSLKLRLEKGPDQREASLLRRLCRLEIPVVVEELDVEEGDALGPVGWGSRSGRESGRFEDKEGDKPQRGDRRLPPAEAQTPGRESRRRFGFPILHRLTPSARLSDQPDHRSINARPALSGMGWMDVNRRIAHAC